VVPFFLGRALNLNMPPQERLEAARNTSNYGTPTQKMEILMTAMSDGGLHQNLLHRKEAPEAPISAELKTYLRRQAPEGLKDNDVNVKKVTCYNALSFFFLEDTLQLLMFFLGLNTEGCNGSCFQAP